MIHERWKRARKNKLDTDDLVFVDLHQILLYFKIICRPNAISFFTSFKIRKEKHETLDNYLFGVIKRRIF